MSNVGEEIEKIYRKIDDAVRLIEVAHAKAVLHRSEPQALIEHYANRIDYDLKRALEHLGEAQHNRIPF